MILLSACCFWQVSLAQGLLSAQNLVDEAPDMLTEDLRRSTCLTHIAQCRFLLRW